MTLKHVELLKYIPECFRMKNVFLFKHCCPLEVVFMEVLQRCYNVVKLTCNIQHKYNAVLQRCSNVAGMSFSQRCENNLHTMLYNVVCTLCVCWVSI